MTRPRAGLAAGGVAAAAILYFLAWPIEADPVAWQPPASPGFAGPFAPNGRLAAAERIEMGGDGPEDVALSADGTLYTGLADGRIVRLRPGGAVETFARTGGRPLGLRFDGQGRLLVADAESGLLAVSATGAVEVLATAHGGRPFRLTDDLDVAPDGTVYFTDASTRFGLEESITAIVEHRATGRLLAYDPRARTTRLVADGLCFANGVAVSPDGEWAFVAETACYRVRRVWLKGPRGGASEVVLHGLPAFPDGITGDGEGTYWLALVSPRDALLDALHPQPLLKRALLRLPAPVRPGPRRHGFVLGLDGGGRIIDNLQDPAGRVALVTNAVPHGRWLYLGSLHGPALARVVRPEPARSLK